MSHNDCGKYAIFEISTGILTPVLTLQFYYHFDPKPSPKVICSNLFKRLLRVKWLEHFKHSSIFITNYTKPSTLTLSRLPTVDSLIIQHFTEGYFKPSALTLSSLITVDPFHHFLSSHNTSLKVLL
jgi:hypothetical protein